MIFFVNDTLLDKKSGIDQAVIKRMQLFERQNIAYTYVTRDWSQDLHHQLNALGVSDRRLLNMFDYYQQMIDIQPNKTFLPDLDFGLKNLRYIDEQNEDRFIVQRNDERLVARVNYQKEDQHVTSVERFDSAGNLYAIDFYNQRGFKSMTQWYTIDHQLRSEVWYTPEGLDVLHATYRQTSQETVEAIGWLLTTPNGQVYQFATITALFEHFVNAINELYPEFNTLILDSVTSADAAFTRLRKPAYTVLGVHNVHVTDTQEPATALLNENYEYALLNVAHFSNVLTTTPKQTADIVARFPDIKAATTIPAGYVTNEQHQRPQVKMNKREFGKMVAITNISPNSNLIDLLHVIKKVHNQIQSVTLDIYGYADYVNNYAEEIKIRQAIINLELEEVVQLKGHVDHLQPVLENAQILVTTAHSSSFDLGLLAGLTNGVVPVAYAVDYAPNALITNDQNGCLVTHGDVDAMAEQIVYLLKHQRILQQFSNSAYETPSAYDEANVWQAWAQLMTIAKEEHQA
ncbi:glycosyltransferase [Periweissella fabaria]|uniref:Poly(Glycerol-phosphate) alpha-glucosyltransferase n=1 Tax=Periweissella fabaria TaxID=546157 RepID=A0ABN8BIC7_9LACO|nr:glycosyltransferase [Periweissella fabaria]MCM0597328.1 glycosyltransferase [Periweissella fabaria]CAH0416168.1 Poly(glycerol-phosphate) alpha-glucosyltransferase [Periweissella fabaria]